MSDLPDPPLGHAEASTAVKLRHEIGGDAFSYLRGTVHRVGTGGDDNPANWVHVDFSRRVLDDVYQHIPFRPEELELADGSPYGRID